MRDLMKEKVDFGSTLDVLYQIYSLFDCVFCEMSKHILRKLNIGAKYKIYFILNSVLSLVQIHKYKQF